MEKRGRSSRQATISEVRQTRASSKSPSRRSSARDKSPTRRSPARKPSPSRVKAASTQRRSGRNKNDNDTASETDDSKPEMTKLTVRVSPLKVDRDGTVRTPVKTGRSKVSNISSDGDEEVARLTSNYMTDRLRRRAVEDPTPSDLSTKRSYSRSVSRSVVDDDDWSHSDTSEKNDGLFSRVARSRSKSVKFQQSGAADPAAEFGGSAGAFALILLVPIVCFSLQYVCSRPDCSLKSVRLEKLKSFATYFNSDSGIIFLLFHWIVSLASLLPFSGVRRTLPQTDIAEAKPLLFNGFFTAVLVASGLISAEYIFQQQIFALIYKNYQQLLLISFVYALLTSTWCFIRSRYVPTTEWNPSGKSGRLVSDFFMGREINPQWFGVFNVKLIHRRMSLITILVINIVFLVRNVRHVAPFATPADNDWHPIVSFVLNLQFDRVAAISSAIWILYVLDQLIHEHHLVSSLELNGDGVGASQLLYYASFPVWANLLSKFANQHKISDVPCGVVAAVGVIAVAGIALKRTANYIKYNFRTQPKGPSVASK